jgi:hypothetical protein
MMRHPLLVAVGWTVASIPLAWGVCNTALNATKLFNGSTPPAATAR